MRSNIYYKEGKGVYKKGGKEWGRFGNMGVLGSAIHPLVRGTTFCLTTPRG